MSKVNRVVIRAFVPACVFAALLFPTVVSSSVYLPSARSATVTSAECETEYQKSSADDTCIEYDRRGNLGISVSNNQCFLRLQCQNRWYNSLTPGLNWNYTEITVDLGDASDLNNCNGVLTNGSC